MYSRSAACDSPHHCTNDDCGGDSGDRVAGVATQNFETCRKPGDFGIPAIPLSRWCDTPLSRWCNTRKRKGETTGNTNFDLNRRASPRPYRANDPLDISVLPGWSRRGNDFVDSHRLNAIVEALTIRCVTIPQQIAGRSVPRKRLGHLRAYAGYYNDIRTHRSLDKDAPVSRSVQRTGIISSHALLGGLHHHYVRV